MDRSTWSLYLRSHIFLDVFVSSSIDCVCVCVGTQAVLAGLVIN